MAKKVKKFDLKKKNAKDDDNISESDFEEPNNFSSEEIKKNLVGHFGKELIKVAVNQLRDEFKQIAMEGGRYGAQMALHGDDMIELQQEVEKRERELLNLRKERKELENELQKQKGRNEELELKITQKEREIKFREDQLVKLNRLLKKQEKELSGEQAEREKKEQKLLTEIKDLKEKYSKARGKLLAKDASKNIAREELQKLRKRIEELEAALADAKKRKK